MQQQQLQQQAAELQASNAQMEKAQQQLEARNHDLLRSQRDLRRMPDRRDVPWTVPRAADSILLGERDDLIARVNFISAQAEFTPPVIYSLEGKACVSHRGASRAPGRPPGRDARRSSVRERAALRGRRAHAPAGRSGCPTLRRGAGHGHIVWRLETAHKRGCGAPDMILVEGTIRIANLFRARPAMEEMIRASRAEAATTVSQVTPSRRPTTAWGTTPTDEPGCGSNANEAKSTGPEPGIETSSAMSASASQPAHQRWAREKRSAPANSARATSPQPTRPAPCRIQEWTSAGAGVRTTRVGHASGITAVGMLVRVATPRFRRVAVMIQMPPPSRTPASR